MLRSDHPLALLGFASTLVEMTTVRPADRWGGSASELTDGPTLFRSFAECGDPSMAALALAVATIHPDEMLARRLLRSATESAPVAPRWLGEMSAIAVDRAVVQTHVLGDGDNHLLSWAWPGGQAATALLYIDHNMGGIVKDAFVIPAGMADVLDHYSELGAGDLDVEPISLADWRARVTAAIATFEITVPPIRQEEWPSCRPLVEWVIRQLPEGGRDYERSEWSEEDRTTLIERFASSPFGAIAGLESEAVRELVDPLVWFACDYGRGDPLRWSPVSVEIVLVDWYARKVFGLPKEAMRRLPEALAGFVRFAHAERSIPPGLTDETLAAIDEYAPDYLDSASAPGRSPFANATRLARLAAGFDLNEFGDSDDSDDSDGPDFFADLLGDDEDYMTSVTDGLEATVAELVGGLDVLAALDDEPLGDVAFDWSGVPDSLAGPTTETLAHLDRWSEELFDVEVRTIARATLRAVLIEDGATFKRSANTAGLAAAILAYLLERLGGRFGAAERSSMGWPTSKKAIADAMGLPASGVTARARTIANVIERAEVDWPRLLHSSQRRDAIASRELIADWRANRFG